MIKIILADPPAKEERYHLSYPNLGILYLISYLREYFKGNGLEVLYLEGHCDLRGHLFKVKEFNPSLYGISFAAETSRLAYKTINSVKKFFPQMKVICGGAHPTAVPEEIMENSLTDICVIGEGEKTLLELVQYEMGTIKRLEDINGIAFRMSEKLISNSKRELIEKIDCIPFPAWDVIDFCKYPGMHFRKANPQTYMSVVRGCPFNCVFCSNPVWKCNRPWLRMREPGKIAEEVDLLYHHGVQEIYLSADEFNVNLKWAKEVCSLICDLGYKDLYFQCNLRVDKITEDFAQYLRKMNVWLVHVGIESGNQRVLDGIQKKITLDQVVNACRLFKKYRIRVFATMMLYQVWEEDGKLCYETTQEVNNSLKFIRQLYSQNLIHYLSWQFATPYPGSQLYDIAKKYSILGDNRIRSVRESNLLIPGIPQKEMKKAMRRGLLLKNFYALKSGNIEWRHWQRMWENIRAVVRF